MGMISHTHKKTLYILLSLIVLAFFVRLIHFRHMTFGYDQARDAIMALEIWSTDPVKLLGPSTDIQGLFHGSLYWYLISPGYILSDGDTLFVRFFQMITLLAVVPLTYFLAIKITRNRTIAIISAILSVFSFEAVQYSRWMSNPTPALLTVPVFFYGLWLSLQKKQVGLPIMFIAFTLSVQFQFFLLYLLPIMIFAGFYIIFTKGLRSLLTKSVVFPMIVGLLFLLPFVLAEARFDFQGLKALTGFFTSGRISEDGIDFIYKMTKFVNSLISNIHNNIIDINRSYAALYMILLAIYVALVALFRKSMRLPVLFLIFWFLSPGIIYPVEENNAYFLNIGNMYPLLILTAMLVWDFTQEMRSSARPYILTLLVGGMIASNVYLITTQNVHGEVLFSVQKHVDLEMEKNIIDWMYKESDGESFSVNTLTNPLFVNTTWAFLFDTYGRQRYGYMPFWAGDEIDERYAGYSISFSDQGFDIDKLMFLIIEPGPSIPNEYMVAYTLYENVRSEFLEEREFGSFRVQKRVIRDRIYYSRNDVFDIAKHSYVKTIQEENIEYFKLNPEEFIQDVELTP